MALGSTYRGGALSVELPKGFKLALKKTISEAFQKAEIEWIEPLRWVKVSGKLSRSYFIELMEADGKGNLHFRVSDHQMGGFAEGWATFHAWIFARIAVKRILPKETLYSDLFRLERVNLAQGQEFYSRGLIYHEKELIGFESVQTILEGRALTTSAIRKTPDVRRGDFVRIHFMSGNLNLSTQGVVQEPSYIFKPVRVIAGKYKKELQGQLLPGGIVEVHL